MNTISGFLMSLKGPVFLELQNCMNNLFGFPLNQKKSFFLELQNCMEYTFWISTGSLSVTDTKKPDVRNTSGCLCGR